MRKGNNYNGGGGRLRIRAKHFVGQCVWCGQSIPPSRWRKVTCDTICDRARKNRRTRVEQLWRDYADDKITI